MRFAFLILMFVGTSAVADTEIYRCPLADGTVAFQEMPCAEPVASDAETDTGESAGDDDASATRDDTFDFVSPFDNPETPPTPTESTLPEPVSQDRAECEKTTRDAIDAIDLQMRQSTYTPEEGQEYLEELRLLTQQLRACKEL